MHCKEFLELLLRNLELSYHNGYIYIYIWLLDLSSLIETQIMGDIWCYIGFRVIVQKQMETNMGKLDGQGA